jgi:hypothetical protein
MIRPASLALAAILGSLVASPMQAQQFTVDLVARAAPEPKIAEARLPDAKPQARAILTAAADAPITVKWTVRNMDNAATSKDVLVHFVVVKQDKPNQAEVPKLTKDVIVESALTMDFKSQDKNMGEITFTVNQSGCYLIRLELKGAADKDGREPFAALDLLTR